MDSKANHNIKGRQVSHKYVAVIQARLGSTRLPQKMLKDLHGHSIYEWVLRRVKGSNLIKQIWVATSDMPENDVLEKMGNGLGVEVFRGSEDNVLSRFVKIARHEKASHIVRICADNPLICPREIDRLVEFSCKNPEKYCFNHIPALGNNYVDGAGAECIPSKILYDINLKATLRTHKEHVSKYLWDNFDEFEFGVVSAPKLLQHPGIRLDIDTFDDFQFLERILGEYQGWTVPESIDLRELLTSVRLADVD